MLYSINDGEIMLGILMNNPKFLSDDRYKIDKEDFRPLLAHFNVFVAIANCGANGCEDITPLEVDQFLQKHKERWNEVNEFSNGDVVGWLSAIKELGSAKNVEYYNVKVRRWSLIRDYKANGCDITQFFDEVKDRDSQIALLESFKIQDILDIMEMKQTQLKRKYTNDDDDTSRKKAGEGGKEVLFKLKTSPKVGLSFESKYLTTLWGGWLKKQLYIRSGDTSSGKSRSCLGDLACVCAKEIYNIKENKWEENPNGTNRGLYIGCEMELDEEVDPLMWAYLSGVESHYIIEGKLDDNQSKLVERAIDVISDNSIWLTDMPNFNLKKLEEEIKHHKYEYNIDFVAFDYILLNNALTNEFVTMRGKGSSFRPDEVLLELSKCLKNLCKKYDIGMITSTQVSTNIQDYRLRDYTVIRGGKSVADNATGGSISMPITNQELKLVEPYISKYGFNPVKPNFVETVYKSRFSKFPKECKIFSHYNLGNMRKQELFVTNKDFTPINVEKTIIDVRGNVLTSEN